MCEIWRNLVDWIFNKKDGKMLSKNELASFESRLKLMQRRLVEETKKTENKELIRAYTAMNRTVGSSLEFLDDISEVQKETTEDIKNFGDFKT